MGRVTTKFKVGDIVYLPLDQSVRLSIPKDLGALFKITGIHPSHVNLTPIILDHNFGFIQYQENLTLVTKEQLELFNELWV